MPEIVIATPSTQTLREQLDSMAIEANGFEVNSPQAYTLAAERLVSTRKFCKLIGEMLDPPVKAAHTAHKEMVANRKKFLEPAQRIERSYGHEMTRWTTEQERLRLVAEAEQRAIAQAAAEEARLAEAVRMEDAGDKEGATRVLDAPIIPAPVMLPDVVPQVKGVTKSRVIWKGRVTDASLVPRDFLIPDQTEINKFAALYKGKRAMPGVEIYSETSRMGVRT